MSADGPVRDRSHLENSRPLRWDRESTAPGWPPTLERLMAKVEAGERRRKARRPADRVRLRETLGAFLLDLYAAHKADPSRWLAYSRNRSDYGPQARYWLPGATMTASATAADFLAAAGLAEHRLGSYNRTPTPFGGVGGRGFRSRLRARPELAMFLEQVGVTPETLGFAPWSELVRLKAAPAVPRGPKRLIGYEDDENTRGMRERLRALNTHLASFRIDLEPVPAEEADGLGGPDRDDDDEEQTDPADGSAVRLYRVFNNGRWDQGGRFYGGWWQALPKRERARLLIDGEETVELDFGGLHPRLCYQLEGQPLAANADPYTLADHGGDAGLRSLVKIAFNQLLNVGPGIHPRAPEGARERLSRGLSYRRLLERIEAAHPALAPWFRRARGVELQWLDSEIASRVLDHLRHRGVCCLPVHDSFIVPRSAEFTLGETMALAYDGVMGGRGPAKVRPVIAGWSSPCVRARVMKVLDRAGA